MFYQIEDKNKIVPEYYEGMKEESSQNGSGYLALIYSKNKNHIGLLPIKHWILFHKNVKYTDENEYNEKVRKAELEFERLQKGPKGLRKLLLKKKESEGEENGEKGKEKADDSGSDTRIKLGVLINNDNI